MQGEFFNVCLKGINFHFCLNYPDFSFLITPTPSSKGGGVEMSLYCTYDLDSDLAEQRYGYTINDMCIVSKSLSMKP